MKSICKRFHSIVLLLLVNSICLAHGINGHNYELKRILFGDNSHIISEKGNLYFRLLWESAFLTLDYTAQDCGKQYMEDLRKNGVKQLPDLKTITFAGNQRHQKYTHMGWEHNYVIDKANWSARKKILLSTVNRIGDFKENERIKIDAFAALVYEIHILGDHIGDSEYTKYDRLRLTSEPGYRGQEVSPTSDGPFNNPTLYIYFLYHIQRLFREQANTYEYNQITGFLNRHKNEFINYKGSNVSYEDITFLAKKTREELIRYLPTLLLRERFFKKAFFEK